MQNLYPLFERNRILKKELLWSLRDYSFTHIQMEYSGYAEGMLQGFDVRVEGKRIVVAPGLVKHGRFIYLVSEEESLEYGVSEELVVVKMRFYTKQAAQEYIVYEMELASDHDTELKDNEIEVCRYKLQEGAVLRDRHTCLEDMDTEYNTLNYIYATWGGIGEKALAPAVTGRFAREILASGNPRPEDICFAYLCLNQRGAVPMELVRDYVARNGNADKESLNNIRIFSGLCSILKHAGNFTSDGQRQKSGRKMILVD